MMKSTSNYSSINNAVLYVGLQEGNSRCEAKVQQPPLKFILSDKEWPYLYNKYGRSLFKDQLVLPI